MRALVVYVYTNHAKNGQIEVSNDWEYFCGDNPTKSEIYDFEKNHHIYPIRCSPKIINIIKVNE